MLKFLKKRIIAVAALSHICFAKNPLSAKEISEHFSYPPQLVGNLLKGLASSGILNSITWSFKRLHFGSRTK